jgi:hypothetical protein
MGRVRIAARVLAPFPWPLHTGKYPSIGYNVFYPPVPLSTQKFGYVPSMHSVLWVMREITSRYDPRLAVLDPRIVIAISASMFSVTYETV